MTSSTSHEKIRIVPPAKVHGDSGVTAVVADIDETTPEESRVPDQETAQPQRQRSFEAGMRS